MKTIGMLGGMSWESTTSYYRLINEGVKQRLGGLHSASICMVSMDFGELEKLQHQGDWDAIAERLAAAARSIEAGGADFLMICTNTMHQVAEQVEAAVSIPLLHIADATGQQLQRSKLKKVGLLGTRFTMEMDFYKARLQDHHGIEVLVPEQEARDFIHRVIYEELCLGKIREPSRERFLGIINQLRDAGAEGVILGCTEIALLVEPQMTDVALFDTAEIHAQQAVNLALD
ncbi:MAG: aspartate/glutamate racemase family protein [Gammaproteobacteria bacterium]